jgi:hypothetical protein
VIGNAVATTDGNEIFVAIEDNGFDQFKPFIVKNAIADNGKNLF